MSNDVVQNALKNAMFNNVTSSTRYNGNIKTTSVSLNLWRGRPPALTEKIEKDLIDSILLPYLDHKNKNFDQSRIQSIKFTIASRQYWSNSKVIKATVTYELTSKEVTARQKQKDKAQADKAKREAERVARDLRSNWASYSWQIKDGMRVISILLEMTKNSPKATTVKAIPRAELTVNLDKLIKEATELRNLINE